jgi:Temperature dependent protein affecting M2 dsRNA replication
VRQLSTLKPPSHIEIKHIGKLPVRNTFIGKRFSNDVYICLSIGLLDCQLIEHAISENYSDDFILAPSYLVRDAWQIPEFKEFWAISVSNLLDRTERDQHALFKATVDTNFKLPEKAEWNITKKNIEDEESRTENKMSFYFVLKWLQYEIGYKKDVKD